MKLGLLFRALPNVTETRRITRTVQNQLHCWKKKSAASCSLWVKLFKSLILVSRWATQFRIIDGFAYTDYTGKIAEIDNNKVKMVISMFGNDTVAEVNLNQIAYNCKKERRWDEIGHSLGIVRRPTSTGSRAKADEISVVKPTQPQNLTTIKNNWSAGLRPAAVL